MGVDAATNTPEDIFGLVGTVLERKFRIDSLVAEGGFGVVYKAFHLTLEKSIAVKVLKTPPEYNDEARASFIEKFRLEARALARISHPAIVQVLDFGASVLPQNGVAPWMVLEWLTGQTLEQILDARPGSGFTPPEVLRLIRPIFEALAFVHDEGIAHRDIKPANIMIVQSKRGQSARLMDFGIAKLMDADEQAGTGMTRTRTANTSFSPQYAAPEQISGSRTGPWTDVHALGLVVTEMLTGTPAYEGADITSIYGEALSAARPTPSRKRVNAGPWEAVLARSLSLKPDERFKSVAEFLAALEAQVPPIVTPMLASVAPASPAPAPAPAPARAADPVNAADTVPVPPGTLAGSTLPNARRAATPAPSPKRSFLLGAGVAAVVALVGVTTWWVTAGRTSAPPTEAPAVTASAPVVPVTAPPAPAPAPAPAQATRAVEPAPAPAHAEPAPSPPAAPPSVAADDDRDRPGGRRRVVRVVRSAPRGSRNAASRGRPLIPLE